MTVFLRLALFQLNANNLNDPSNGFIFNDFSLFKYGDKEVTKQYGNAIADLLVENGVDSNSDTSFAISGSAFREVPVAATYLTAEIARICKEREVPMKMFKIERKAVSIGDYSKMGANEREATMASTQLKIKKSDIEGRDVIIVDDIYITGGHEKKLRDTLEIAGAERVIFVYIAKVNDAASNPALESTLNASKVKTWEDWFEIEKCDPYVNVRYLRFLLKIDSSKYGEIISEIKIKCHFYVKLIEADKLDEQTEYADNFQIFKKTCQDQSPVKV